MAAPAAIVEVRDVKVQLHGFQCLRPSGLVALGRFVRAALVSFSSSSSSSVIRVVSTPIKPDVTKVKRSKVEVFKEKSNYLRYPLKEELLTEAPSINETATQLIKFHWSYQQTNRDERGKVPNKPYLVMDNLADEFGIATLRLTTRQTFQLHGRATPGLGGLASRARAYIPLDDLVLSHHFNYGHGISGHELHLPGEKGYILIEICQNKVFDRGRIKADGETVTNDLEDKVEFQDGSIDAHA